MAPLSSQSKLGVASRFTVEIDGYDLGGWAKCSGLEVDFQLKPYVELGNNSFTYQFPSGAKYKNVILERACTPQESQQVQAWLASMIAQPVPGTASIKLHDAWKSEVLTWTLTGVYPARWSGPSFDADSHELAKETLEISHWGFLEG
jgi:phage tail-like protein